MNTLPVEIIDNIIPFITYSIPSFAGLASISPSWQYAIERRTFSSLYTTSVDFKTWGHAVAARRAFLRNLDYTIILPRVGERAQLHQVFTAAVNELLRVLGGGDNGRPMSLSLGGRGDGSSGSHKRRQTKLLPHGYAKYISGDADTLPVVRRVTYLSVWCINPAYWRISLRVAVDLARQMPQLRSIFIEGTVEPKDLRRKGGVPYREDRLGLAEALVEADYLSGLRDCTSVSLELKDRDPELIYTRRKTFVFPDCTNGLGYDPLSAALRMWSHNLVSLNLEGGFDDSVFWPRSAEKSAKTPEFLWPRLKTLHVELGLLTPEGGWYFDPTPARAWTEYYKFHSIPNDDTLQPLFESWAKALECMPALEIATILFRVEIEEREIASDMRVEDWMVSFQAPNIVLDPRQHPYERNLSAGELSSSRLIFRNVGSWRPRKSIMSRLYRMRKNRFPDVDAIDLAVNMFEEVRETRVLYKGRPGLRLGP
ncbi:hypothetical protein F5Y04DRAFT_10263 [Hypomontagnella monticulosa]|nr:hypothetical protein F5Y04DRAFT_10263 [Hypomontagnella monticulosa]